MGEVFVVAEIGTIHEVGAKIAVQADLIRSISASPGFDTCAASMPSSAIGAVCQGKDATFEAILERAAGRLEEVAASCHQAGNDLIRTEESLASGFRAIGTF